jgi:hypothetical protein
MLAAPASAYRGDQLHELTLKQALQRLSPLFTFDHGSNLDIWHPKRNRWQGVYHNGRHVAAMGRGSLPEFNLYREEPLDDGSGYGRGELLEIGWRTTCEQIARQWLSSVTWAKLARELGVDYKMFVGSPTELHIPDRAVEDVFNTLG